MSLAGFWRYLGLDPSPGYMTSIELYEVAGCGYCAMVKSKLEELDLEYTTQRVPRARSRRDEVKRISGQTGVPVLVDEAHGVDGMPESRDILKYLEATYGT